jgi:hypothetical protein
MADQTLLNVIDREGVKLVRFRTGDILREADAEAIGKELPSWPSRRGSGSSSVSSACCT